MLLAAKCKYSYFCLSLSTYAGVNPKTSYRVILFCPDTFTRSDFFSCHPGPFPFTRLEEDTKLDK